MKKYSNNSLFIKIIIFLAHPIYILSIGLSFIYHKGYDYSGLIGMTIALGLSLASFDLLLFICKDIWYTTYIDEKFIYQKFFGKTKLIHYTEIRIIIIVGELAILTKNDSKNELDKLDYSIHIRKELLRKYKKDLIVSINANDNSFLMTLDLKSDAKIIVISKNKTIISLVNKYLIKDNSI